MDELYPVLEELSNPTELYSWIKNQTECSNKEAAAICNKYFADIIPGACSGEYITCPTDSNLILRGYSISDDGKTATEIYTPATFGPLEDLESYYNDEYSCGKCEIDDEQNIRIKKIVSLSAQKDDTSVFAFLATYQHGYNIEYLAELVTDLGKAD
ncbi:hypothetical protein IJ425_07575 [bacterium]|nr:hypothetical protein [bacterium]